MSWRQGLSLLLAALLACHPLLMQAQTYGDVRVRMEGEDIPVRYNRTVATGAMDIRAGESEVALTLGGGGYPVVEILVPVEPGRVTEVRGDLPTRLEFPPLIGVAALDTIYTADDIIDPDSLLNEGEKDRRWGIHPATDIVIGSILLGISLLMMLSSIEFGGSMVDFEGTSGDDASDDDEADNTVPIVIYSLGLGLIGLGIAQLTMPHTYRKPVRYPQNIAYNDSLRAVAAVEASRMNNRAVSRENAVRMQVRRAAIAETFIQYRIGDGPWVDITPDPKEFLWPATGKY